MFSQPPLSGFFGVYYNMYLIETKLFILIDRKLKQKYPWFFSSLLFIRFRLVAWRYVRWEANLMAAHIHKTSTSIPNTTNSPSIKKKLVKRPLKIGEKMFFRGSVNEWSPLHVIHVWIYFFHKQIEYI